jgi:hypothetical protein
MTETYTPEPGHRVRVRRYEVPCPELPGHAERKLLLELDGTVASVQPKAGGVLFRLKGMEDLIYTGYQFSGQDSGHGCSWSLVTEVIRAGDVAAHDQAERAARVAARDAEVVARQRLKGAQERLEATMRGAS